MASLVLSVLLWLYVQVQEATKIEYTFFAPVEVNPAPDNLHLVTSKPTIEVSVWGTADAIDDFKRRSRNEPIRAFVDGRIAKDGENDYKPSYGPTRLLANVEIREPKNIKLRFEEKITLSRKVEIVPGGTLPEGFELGATDVNPPSVTISGPKSLIFGSEVQATIDLSKIESGSTKQVRVEVRDRAGTPIPADRIEVSPGQVEVTPSLTPAKPRRSLLISPRYVGQPAPGFHVSRVELSYSEVKVQGDRTKLKDITVLDTEPISIAGLKAKTRREVDLQVPKGLIVQGPRKVTVTIFIEPDATAPAPAQPPPGP